MAATLQSNPAGETHEGVKVNISSNIYNFTDYREFLKDRYRQLKINDPLFSFRHFSKSAGFGSPNYLKLVMDGKRNLSAEAIAKFAKGLRLDNHESEYKADFVIPSIVCLPVAGSPPWDNISELISWPCIIL